MDLNEVALSAVRRHPWEVARAKFFCRVLRDSGVTAKPRTLLDVGAGDGYLARLALATLPAGSEAVCLDAQYSDDDLRRFAEPPVAGLSFTRDRPERRFDVLLLLDVIEHVPDDAAFLGQFVHDNLAPEGKVLVSVPAWQALFSLHDEALEHYRRYSPAACRRLLCGAGLTIRASSGLFHSLLLPRTLTVAHERWARRLGRSVGRPPHLGQWRGGPFLSLALGWALAADNAVSRLSARAGWAVPGLSTWALCDGPTGPSA